MTRTVRVEMRKWPDSPHWEFEGPWLGADGHGQWIGVREGTWLSRPGAGFHATADHVVVMPYEDWWSAVFYGVDPALDAERPVDVYVDVATPPVWSGDTVRCIDLDLDVIRGVTGRVWVDDEDEFAAHRVELGYTDDVVEQAVASCREVLDRVERGTPPFDAGTSARWLEKLRGL
ncbi:MAG: DUF402 domain-containing protein [Marmoricola sp.]